MKELYISPELKVTCFAPVERLASEDGVLTFGDLLFASGYRPEAARSEGKDIDLEL